MKFLFSILPLEINVYLNHWMCITSIDLIKDISKPGVLGSVSVLGFTDLHVCHKSDRLFILYTSCQLHTEYLKRFKILTSHFE